MNKLLLRSVIRECQSQQCGFRFPDTNSLEKQISCPICKSPTEIKHEIDLTMDSRKGNFWNFPNEFIVVLDNLRSVYNVGAIFRTALGFGIKKIYLCGITPTPDHLNFNKSSLGAEKHLSWVKTLNSIQTCQLLHNQGFKIISVETTESALFIQDIKVEMFMNRKIVLIVGNEITGVDPDVLGISDFVVNIPINGANKSFNVTTAFGIALYQFASFLST